MNVKHRQSITAITLELSRMQYETRMTVIAFQSSSYKLLSKGVSSHILYTKLFAAKCIEKESKKESKIKWPRERKEEANGQQKPKSGATFNQIIFTLINWMGYKR